MVSEYLLSLKLMSEAPSARLNLLRSRFHIPTGAHTFDIVLNEVATAWFISACGEARGGEGSSRLLSYVMAAKMQAWPGEGLVLELVPDSDVKENLSAAMMCH